MNAPEQLFLNLHDDPEQLRGILTKTTQHLKTAEGRINLLETRVAFLEGKLFGQTSEKLGSDEDHAPQIDLFDEAETLLDNDNHEDDDGIDIPAHKRQRGRAPLPKDLPRIRIEHDLSDEEKQCDCCGVEKTCIGEDISEQLEIIPATLQVLQHVRLKYACLPCENGVVTAPLPPQPLPKSKASPALLAFITINKFMDALPLYRQEKILNRLGIEITRATLASWMIKLGVLIQPLINLLRDELMDYDIMGMDETRIQVLKEADRLPTTNSQMWVQRGGRPDKPVILFYYDPSRGQHVAAELLAGYKGFVQTDGYAVYQAVEKKEAELILLGCMAHARRKFYDAFKVQKKGTTGTHAHKALAYIKKLYTIERKIKQASPEKRFDVRQKQAKPILDKMRAWLDKTLPCVPPKSLTGKALGYMDNQWKYLIRYLEDGRLSIDNNSTENTIRPFVIGRRNWLFSDSMQGAKASANLYSLIGTTRALGIEPFRYLRHVFTQLPLATSVEQIEALLPYNIDKQSLNQLHY